MYAIKVLIAFAAISHFVLAFGGPLVLDTDAKPLDALAFAVLASGIPFVLGALLYGLPGGKR